MTLGHLNSFTRLYLYARKVLLVWFVSVVFSAQALSAQLYDEQPKLLVLGDSLSAAIRMDTKDGWVNLLQQRFNETGVGWSVVNGSISGNTTADGLARLPALLAHHQPALLIVELGANDGLRGYPIKTMKRNLFSIIAQAEAAGAAVALVQMEIPPNYGKRYTKSFKAAFTELANEADIALLPFFLYDIIGDANLMQNDGIHPNAAAQPLIVDTLWPDIKKLTAMVVDKSAKM